MESRALSTQDVPRWVRVGAILAIAIPQIVTGAWAVVAPKHWFDNFPGIGPTLVAAEPPYNAHLASDAGAGFLAAGIAVAVAAILGRQMLLVFALAIYAVGAVPHVLYHAINPAPALSNAENTVSVMMLATGLAAAVVFVARTWKRSPRERGLASEETATTRRT